MLEHVWLIPLLPLLSFVIIFFFGEYLPMQGAFVGIAAIGWGLLHTSCLFAQAALGKLPLPYEAGFTWFHFGVYETELGVLIDGLTLGMLLVVTLVSFCVQLYSVGYMHDDPRFKRFYAYLSLFTFSMLTLVVANNMLQFFIGWEIMGAMSYFLISFWFEKPSAAYAGKKAFVTTKLGDLGFFLGILSLFHAFGTFSIGQIEAHIAKGVIDPNVAGMIALLLFVGAMGKSAQFPLFIWLPDAMEGPTPVSALIHAATMVAAGVYMVARLFPLYHFGTNALETVSWFGALTAFMAASMAFVANDIKRVLAFSTVSQLGFMMLALGCGGLTAGVFHLTTHGFFKALLFLGAGSVIHAVHTNDMQEMGGLKSKMPVTYWTFLIATLAISGIPPFAGYFSKDEILEAVLRASPMLYVVASVAAGMTTFYMFRAVFLTFHGEARDHHKYDHAHESPAVMTVPLILLAVFSVFAGMALGPTQVMEKLVHFEAPVNEVALPFPGYVVSVIATGISLVSIALSYLFFIVNPSLADRAKAMFPGIYRILDKRYYLDDIFLFLVDCADALARGLFWFDFNFIDQLVIDGYGYLALLLSSIQAWFDRIVVDGAVDFFGTATRGVGSVARSVQTGYIQNYLLYVAMAVALMATMLLTRF